MMSVAITWNGGENAIMLSPSVKVLVAFFSIFTIGVVCVGLAGLTLIGGIGFLIWQIALLALHVLSVAVYSSVFSFILSLLLSALFLVLFIVLSLRVLGIVPYPRKGGAA